jgi:hypothetical protein
MVREPGAATQPTLQDNQLMSKHRILSLKPHLRLEWQGQHGLDETQEPDHSASLVDSIAPSTRIRFSVHTAHHRPVDAIAASKLRFRKLNSILSS